jgi:hypothetical protein
MPFPISCQGDVSESDLDIFTFHLGRRRSLMKEGNKTEYEDICLLLFRKRGN